MHSRHLLAFVVSGSLLMLSTGACGDSVKTIQCPLGTRPEGSQCIPIEAGDTNAGDTISGDTGVGDTDTIAPTDSANESSGTATDSTTTNPGDSTDTAVSEVDASPGPTGATCLKNTDCAGGTCLNWQDGYCTKLDCGPSDCGGDAACIALEGNHLCLATCERDADCATSNQRCKGLVVDDAIVHACVAVAADAHPIGHACSAATDCAGAATCLPSFPGGYCGIVGCTAGSCPGGAVCVRVDGAPTCLAGCVGDGDCNSVEGAERKCGVLPGVDQSPTSVCVSGLEGKLMGAACLSDFECASGACQILGEGRCSVTNRPCSTATATADCTAAEFCRVNATSRVGVCSQPCAASGSVACPGSSFCVTDGWNTHEAWCRPSCTKAGVDPACNAAAGLTCGYGIPLSDGGGGRYVCTRVRSGVPLAACTGDADCGTGVTCVRHNGAGQGTCGATCGEDSYCPFGGLCGDYSGAAEPICYRACLSGDECPSGFSCARTGGSAWPVCVP